MLFIAGSLNDSLAITNSMEFMLNPFDKLRTGLFQYFVCRSNIRLLLKFLCFKLDFTNTYKKFYFLPSYYLNSITVISGEQLNLIGKIAVPIPRLTYKFVPLISNKPLAYLPRFSVGVQNGLRNGILTCPP